MEDLSASSELPVSHNQLRQRDSSHLSKQDASREIVMEERSVGLESGTEPHERHEMLTKDENSTEINIRFDDLCYSVPEGKGKAMKMILKSMNGEFRAGELTAIMGPSGAGKSTLMNILAGFRCSNVTGNILINGEERNLKKFSKRSCYIMQRDELCPVLTVSELMAFAANLKLGNHKTQKAKRQLIDETLETMGLVETKGTRTANLSGGQKKRLAIALELINNPPVMFFDEPTSGLDSTSCIQCVSLMKTLARGGRTIICVIHQPSSSVFEMFDQLYLLAKGQCVYQGPTKDVIRFISKEAKITCPNYHSPADFAIDVIAGKYGEVVEQLVEAVRNKRRSSWVSQKSIDNHAESELSSSSSSNQAEAVGYEQQGMVKLAMIDEISEFNRELEIKALKANTFIVPDAVSEWNQFVVILKKTMICIYRDRVLTRVRLIVHLVFGLIAGLMYFNIGNDASQVYNNGGSLIFGQLFLMGTAKMPQVITFPLEMPILLREQLNNWYTLRAYYLAKSVADAPYQMLYPAVYILIVYFMSSQPLEVDRFFMYLTMGIMTSLVAQSIGLAIGAALPIQAAVFLGPVSTVPLFLFSGFFITYNAVPNYMRWLCYTVYIRYGFEGAMLSIYGYDRPSLNCPDEFCHFKTPSKFLKFMDMSHASYWIDFGVLLGFFLVIRFLTFFILRWKLQSYV